MVVLVVVVAAMMHNRRVDFGRLGPPSRQIRVSRLRSANIVRVLAVGQIEWYGAEMSLGREDSAYWGPIFIFCNYYLTARYQY